jgi:ubiquitin C-terminal hydrolase
MAALRSLVECCAFLTLFILSQALLFINCTARDLDDVARQAHTGMLLKVLVGLMTFFFIIWNAAVRSPPSARKRRAREPRDKAGRNPPSAKPSTYSGLSVLGAYAFISVSRSVGLGAFGLTVELIVLVVILLTTLSCVLLNILINKKMSDGSDTLAPSSDASAAGVPPLPRSTGGGAPSLNPANAAWKLHAQEMRDEVRRLDLSAAHRLGLSEAHLACVLELLDLLLSADSGSGASAFDRRRFSSHAHKANLAVLVTLAGHASPAIAACAVRLLAWCALLDTRAARRAGWRTRLRAAGAAGALARALERMARGGFDAGLGELCVSALARLLNGMDAARVPERDAIVACVLKWQAAELIDASARVAAAALLCCPALGDILLDPARLAAVHDVLDRHPGRALGVVPASVWHSALVPERAGAQALAEALLKCVSDALAAWRAPACPGAAAAGGATGALTPHLAAAALLLVARWCRALPDAEHHPCGTGARAKLEAAIAADSLELALAPVGGSQPQPSRVVAPAAVVSGLLEVLHACGRAAPVCALRMSATHPRLWRAPEMKRWRRALHAAAEAARAQALAAAVRARGHAMLEMLCALGMTTGGLAGFPSPTGTESGECVPQLHCTHRRRTRRRGGNLRRRRRRHLFQSFHDWCAARNRGEVLPLPASADPAPPMGAGASSPSPTGTGTCATAPSPSVAAGSGLTRDAPTSPPLPPAPGAVPLPRAAGTHRVDRDCAAVALAAYEGSHPQAARDRLWAASGLGSSGLPSLAALMTLVGLGCNPAAFLLFDALGHCIAVTILSRGRGAPLSDVFAVQQPPWRARSGRHATVGHVQWLPVSSALSQLLLQLLDLPCPAISLDQQQLRLAGDTSDADDGDDGDDGNTDDDDRGGGGGAPFGVDRVYAHGGLLCSPADSSCNDSHYRLKLDVINSTQPIHVWTFLEQGPLPTTGMVSVVEALQHAPILDRPETEAFVIEVWKTDNSWGLLVAADTKFALMLIPCSGDFYRLFRIALTGRDSTHPVVQSVCRSVRTQVKTSALPSRSASANLTLDGRRVSQEGSHRAPLMLLWMPLALVKVGKPGRPKKDLLKEKINDLFRYAASLRAPVVRAPDSDAGSDAEETVMPFVPVDQGGDDGSDDEALLGYVGDSDVAVIPAEQLADTQVVGHVDGVACDDDEVIGERSPTTSQASPVRPATVAAAAPETPTAARAVRRDAIRGAKAVSHARARALSPSAPSPPSRPLPRVNFNGAHPNAQSMSAGPSALREDLQRPPGYERELASAGVFSRNVVFSWRQQPGNSDERSLSAGQQAVVDDAALLVHSSGGAESAHSRVQTHVALHVSTTDVAAAANPASVLFQGVLCGGLRRVHLDTDHLSPAQRGACTALLDIDGASTTIDFTSACLLALPPASVHLPTEVLGSVSSFIDYDRAALNTSEATTDAIRQQYLQLVGQLRTWASLMASCRWVDVTSRISVSRPALSESSVKPSTFKLVKPPSSTAKGQRVVQVLEQRQYPSGAFGKVILELHIPPDGPADSEVSVKVRLALAAALQSRDDMSAGPPTAHSRLLQHALLVQRATQPTEFAGGGALLVDLLWAAALALLLPTVTVRLVMEVVGGKVSGRPLRLPLADELSDHELLVRAVETLFLSEGGSIVDLATIMQLATIVLGAPTLFTVSIGNTLTPASTSGMVLTVTPQARSTLLPPNMASVDYECPLGLGGHTRTRSVATAPCPTPAHTVAGDPQVSRVQVYSTASRMAALPPTQNLPVNAYDRTTGIVHVGRLFRMGARVIEAATRVGLQYAADGSVRTETTLCFNGALWGAAHFAARDAAHFAVRDAAEPAQSVLHSVVSTAAATSWHLGRTMVTQTQRSSVDGVVRGYAAAAQRLLHLAHAMWIGADSVDAGCRAVHLMVQVIQSSLLLSSTHAWRDGVNTLPRLHRLLVSDLLRLSRHPSTTAPVASSTTVPSAPCACPLNWAGEHAHGCALRSAPPRAAPPASSQLQSPTSSRELLAASWRLFAAFGAARDRSTHNRLGVFPPPAVDGAAPSAGGQVPSTIREAAPPASHAPAPAASDAGATASSSLASGAGSKVAARPYDSLPPPTLSELYSMYSMQPCWRCRHPSHSAFTCNVRATCAEIPDVAYSRRCRKCDPPHSVFPGAKFTRTRQMENYPNHSHTTDAHDVARAARDGTQLPGLSTSAPLRPPPPPLQPHRPILLAPAQKNPTTEGSSVVSSRSVGASGGGAGKAAPVVSRGAAAVAAALAASTATAGSGGGGSGGSRQVKGGTRGHADGASRDSASATAAASSSGSIPSSSSAPPLSASATLSATSGARPTTLQSRAGLSVSEIARLSPAPIGMPRVGLRNVTGTSCYINAALQALLRTPELLERLEFVSSAERPLHYQDAVVRKDSAGEKLWKATRSTLASMFKAFCELEWPNGAPESHEELTLFVVQYFQDRLRISPESNASAQQCCAEFTGHLLAALEETTSRAFVGPNLEPAFDPAHPWHVSALRKWEFEQKRNMSPVWDLFQGESISLLTCPKCKTTHYSTPITYNRLLLEFGTDVSISDSRRLYTVKELLQYNRPERVTNYLCTVCNKRRDVQKEDRIVRPPQMLWMHVRRFTFVDNTQCKITNPVTVPMSLDLPLCDPDATTPQYDLYAVVDHSGGVQGGHYWTHAVDPATGTWYTYDDDKEVVEYDTANLNNSRGAYMLFYRRRDVPPAARARASVPAPPSLLAARPAAVARALVAAPSSSSTAAVGSSDDIDCSCRNGGDTPCCACVRGLTYERCVSGGVELPSCEHHQQMCVPQDETESRARRGVIVVPGSAFNRYRALVRCDPPSPPLAPPPPPLPPLLSCPRRHPAVSRFERPATSCNSIWQSPRPPPKTMATTSSWSTTTTTTTTTTMISLQLQPPKSALPVCCSLTAPPPTLTSATTTKTLTATRQRASLPSRWRHSTLHRRGYWPPGPRCCHPTLRPSARACRRGPRRP